MSTRISSAILILLLAGCGERSADPTALARVDAAENASEEADGKLVCATHGAADFTRQCTLDRETSGKQLILTVRNPDGGFHRLLVTTDGRGVIAADGAEAARVRIIGDGRIEVAIGDDRYQLPATVKDATPAS